MNARAETRVFLGPSERRRLRGRPTISVLVLRRRRRCSSSKCPAADVFGKIGREYGGALHDATVRIAAAARALDKVLVAMPLESKLYFPDLSPGTLEGFKDLRRWQAVPDSTPEASWLKKFLFALHSVAETNETGAVLREGGAPETWLGNRARAATHRGWAMPSIGCRRSSGAMTAVPTW